MEFKLKPFKIQLTVSRIANIHYFEFTHNYNTKGDRHAFCELVYVDSGALHIRADNFCGALTENQMILHGANETHSLACPDDSAPNVIIIGFECECEALTPFSRRAVTLSEPLKRLLAEIIREGRAVFLPPYDKPNVTDMKKRENYSFGADQLIKLLLETFLIKLVREESEVMPIPEEVPGGDALLVREESAAAPIYEEAPGGDALARGIVEYVRRNFTEKISLGELAFLFGTNRTTLCKNFRAATGQPIVEYVNGLKIREAKKMMRTGGKTFTEIAELLRFDSIHYFTRVFKKAENMTPSEYIRTIKSKLDG